MDLQEIDGVGPKTEERLNDAGIHTVEDLAETAPDIEVPGVNPGDLESHIQSANELVPAAGVPDEMPSQKAADDPVFPASRLESRGHEEDGGFLNRMWKRITGG